MTDDPLATARAWLAAEMARTMIPGVHPVEWRSLAPAWCWDACAAALAAAVQAKGEADADLVGTHPQCFARSEAFVYLQDHAADVPPPPRTP